MLTFSQIFSIIYISNATVYLQAWLILNHRVELKDTKDMHAWQLLDIFTLRSSNIQRLLLELFFAARLNGEQWGLSTGVAGGALTFHIRQHIRLYVLMN